MPTWLRPKRGARVCNLQQEECKAGRKNYIHHFSCRLNRAFFAIALISFTCISVIKLIHFHTKAVYCSCITCPTHAKLMHFTFSLKLSITVMTSSCTEIVHFCNYVNQLTCKVYSNFFSSFPAN